MTSEGAGIQNQPSRQGKEDEQQAEEDPCKHEKQNITSSILFNKADQQA